MSEHAVPTPPMPNIQPTTINLSTEGMERFARNFEASARRWELIVYPSLFAFIVLASYFFFLIYRLTGDVALMAGNVAELTKSIDRMSVDVNAMSTNLNAVSLNMNQMTRDLSSVAYRMEVINDDMGTMTKHFGAVSQKMDVLEPMQTSLFSMEKSTRSLAFTTDQMRHSVQSMNRGINESTLPMQRINSFMPFW
jgi:hypothetical protein